MDVAVLGAGTMGHGIAQVSAMAGHGVSMRDIEESIVTDGLAAIEATLEEGIERDKVTSEEADETLARIEGTTDLAAAVTGADPVIEAVPEDLDLKQEPLERLQSHVDAGTVLASNTSSLSLTAIASALDRPEGAVGLHFFNPVHLMALVEIVVAEQTEADTVAFAREFVAGIDTTPVAVTDSTGFATSRHGAAEGAEAMRMLQEGVASPWELDRAMELGYNHPMGPIELGDVVGLDVRLDSLEYLREELGERFRPPGTLRRKVRAGKLGRTTGEGFYVWSDGKIVATSDGGKEG